MSESAPTADDLLHARLRLTLVPGLGPVLTRRLYQQFGDAAAICNATTHQLSQIDGIGRRKAELFRRAMDEADVLRELSLIQQHGVTLLALDDPGYPPLLKHIADPPPVLYVRGSIEARDSLGLAVVGSRQCSTYGREQADRLSALCSQAGLTIISGGARGIDTAAHRAALRVGGRTIAVVGCGLAQCYPPENRELFEAIAGGGGAVVSELPMNSPPMAENFPARNRIISGLSLGVLVVEASHRSGALITARLAAEEHHREVMALPGRVDSVSSTGCHKIIREGWATLVTNPGEILDCLGEAGQTLKVALAEAPQPEPPAESAAPAPQTLFSQSPAGKVLECMGRDPITLDQLADAAGMTIAQLQAHLTQLQITGQVQRLPGNRVQRRS